MPKIAIIAFTARGAALASNLVQALGADGYAFGRYATGTLQRVDDRLAWCAARWADHDALLFIGASGIAVRTIAPFVKDKTTDPAVLCIDEAANFVVSLLSGHIGGANALATQVAALTGATPVISTATDVNHTFAVDVFATQNRLDIASMPLAKAVAVAILHGQAVGLFSDFPLNGEIPKALTLNVPQKINIAICAQNPNRADSLWLRPKPYVLGIGCKRNTPADQIAQAVDHFLATQNISLADIAYLASIDLKKDEVGILSLAQQARIPFYTYSTEDLMAVEGTFSTSPFVQKTTGVDCVCERSAVLAGGGTLITPKTAGNGITLALATRNIRSTL